MQTYIKNKCTISIYQRRAKSCQKPSEVETAERVEMKNAEEKTENQSDEILANLTDQPTSSSVDNS